MYITVQSLSSRIFIACLTIVNFLFEHKSTAVDNGCQGLVLTSHKENVTALMNIKVVLMYTKYVSMNALQ